MCLCVPSYTRAATSQARASNVQATLTQSGVPLQGDGVMWGEVTRPDGSQSILTFQPGEPGSYAAEFVAGSAGVHKLRVRARGRTRKGMPFTREQTLTAVVWRGGDRDAETGAADRLFDALNDATNACASCSSVFFVAMVPSSPSLRSACVPQGWTSITFANASRLTARDDGNRRTQQDG